MTTSAKIICDSIGPNGVRLTTFVITFPRFILPEFNTHRMFSRNGASSRAIPVSKQIEKVTLSPFIPEAFNKNAKGMQGAEVVNDEIQKKAVDIWLKMRDACAQGAQALSELGIAKQYANRPLEAFNFTTMVVTATEYSNFFALRYHSMAQPEIAELASKMWSLYSTTTPTVLKEGQWHLPFVTNEDRSEQAFASIAGRESLTEQELHEDFWLPLIIKSVARCARTSYNNHDGTNSTYEQDKALYDRLLAEQPMHSSPAEHQAQARDGGYMVASEDEFSGNLRGWIQYRKTLKNENITEFTGPLG